MWFIGVDVEQETSAPPPKKNPGSAIVLHDFLRTCEYFNFSFLREKPWGRGCFFSYLLPLIVNENKQIFFLSFTERIFIQTRGLWRV